MCGRYSLELSYDLFVSRYGLDIESTQYNPSTEIFPTQVQPILVEGPILSFAKWGFSNPYSSRALINARLETITQKPTFKKAFLETRCLIPATSFFEWEKDQDEKIKRKIFVDKQKVFSMAGIVREEEQGLVYSILTMDSNKHLKKVHHRMPVILQVKDELKYLNKNTSSQDVLRMCQESNPTFLIK